ncbi:molybdate ABC transporter substrate-binding protein [Cellulomonas sp. PhB143]|uniref:molybdate ABC transporter substrate-binding protein n=1 Tax=Cellulomonas sp. PhB143 TaxID=2485186 RepID=UPI000F49E1D8|nr:molybdate ABC transporter substrate-binding protein [Cellulomonas sp. PhB143]ROS72130.1 molybdate transport system substrate-binding protein [Cellulomonas sp. PhB143]
MSPRPRTTAALASGALLTAALLTTTLLTTALLAGCGTSSDGAGDTSATDGASSGTSSATESGTLTVLAAASLRDVFADLADDFEAAHPGVEVKLSFAGSSDLADQVIAGSPADVLATADDATMQRVVDAGDAADPTEFATNSLTIVVPPDDPAGIDSFDDLADPDARVVVCAPEVPCGAATDAVEKKAGVTVHRVSEESSVTDVLAKVTSGEADAGLVYTTDATLAGDAVAVVDVPETHDVVNHYPIAVLGSSEHADLAAQFRDEVTGDAGQKALAEAGFGAP